MAAKPPYFPLFPYDSGVSATFWQWHSRGQRFDSAYLYNTTDFHFGSRSFLDFHAALRYTDCVKICQFWRKEGIWWRRSCFLTRRSSPSPGRFWTSVPCARTGCNCIRPPRQRWLILQRDIPLSAVTTSSPTICALSTKPSPPNIWPSTPSACRRCSFPCGPITLW